MGGHIPVGNRRPSSAILLAALLFLGGCSAPLSIERLNLTESYQQMDRSALSGDVLSNATQIVLRRHSLSGLWKKDPDAAIAALRMNVIADPNLWPEFFSLAELSFLQGKRQQSQADFLAAALYAFAFLDPGSEGNVPNPFDDRFRQAANIYNLSLVAAFPPAENGQVQIISGQRELPFGTIDLAADPSQMSWHGCVLTDFEPTANIAVTGIKNLYRNPGLGEPLAASPRQPPQSGTGLVIPSQLKVPSNLLLIVDAPRQQLARAHLNGRLMVHTFDEQQSIEIGQQRVPLEYDQTAARALGLAAAGAGSNELSRFLSGTILDQSPSELIALQPHELGHMPVILIHGTASSPFRWANMVNDLLENPEIQAHFEFWFFSYGSGNPIPYSALQLRRSIEEAITELGGVKADPALGQITLIGHSQGGLLAKMLVIDPGDRLWNGVSAKPLSALNLSDKTRNLIRETLFPVPLPEVRRVIFIATPQRGSYLAAFSLSQMIGGLVKLPLAVAETSKEIVTGNDTTAILGGGKLRLGSIYGMSPNNPFIKTLATIPVVPYVHTHSIIPVQTGGPLAEGNDGVVSYRSAHIEGVDSELVVRSGHSAQSNSATIAEVARILMLQLKSSEEPAAR
jgi:pimeloyl-ACP methyl ester carboxylesterase